MSAQIQYNGHNAGEISDFLQREVFDLGDHIEIVEDGEEETRTVIPGEWVSSRS